MSDEAKAPKFTMDLEDAQGKPIEPDWSFVVSNQFTQITQNSAIIENQKRMIEELQKIIELWNAITVRQATMISAISLLSASMDKARVELKNTFTGILQVPIAIMLIAGSSWLFYLKYIEEYTWLIVCAVAAFRYLGDSISGVVRLLGLGRANATEKEEKEKTGC